MAAPRRRCLQAVATLALVAGSALAWAGDRQSGDWTWNVDDRDYYVAGIESAKDHMLAQFCSTEDGECFYVVGFGINCEPGNEYPILVNADTGAAHLKFVCATEIEDQHVLIASDFDAIDNIVRTSNRVGFAIPMANDEFKAVRFSLRGSVQAIDSMRAALLDDSNVRSKVESKPAVQRF